MQHRASGISSAFRCGGAGNHSDGNFICDNCDSSGFELCDRILLVLSDDSQAADKRKQVARLTSRQHGLSLLPNILVAKFFFQIKRINPRNGTADQTAVPFDNLGMLSSIG